MVYVIYYHIFLLEDHVSIYIYIIYHIYMCVYTCVSMYIYIYYILWCVSTQYMYLYRYALRTIAIKSANCTLELFTGFSSTMTIVTIVI